MQAFIDFVITVRANEPHSLLHSPQGPPDSTWCQCPSVPFVSYGAFQPQFLRPAVLLIQDSLKNLYFCGISQIVAVNR